MPPELDDLVHCVRSAISAKLLLAGLERDLFTWLGTPKGPAEIAAHFGWHPGTTEKYCEILSYLGLVCIQNGKVRNTEAAARHLSRTSPENTAAYILESCKWCLHPLDELPRILREGPTPPERDTDSESLWEEIISCGTNMVVMDSGRKMAERLAALPGADGFRRMLDLGGGHGVYSLCAAEAMPRLKADVLDFPSVLRVAERFHKDSPAADRVRLVPGNYVAVPFAPGYDLIFVSETLNFTLPGGTTQRVMDKIYAALASGGYCVSVHDGPVGAALVPDWPFECHVIDMVSGSPMAMPDGLIAEAMLTSGFSSVRTEHVRLKGSLMTLNVGRK